LPDASAEEVRRTHASAIEALQADANARAFVVVSDVRLPDATEVPVAHKLGRTPRIVKVSVPRGAVAAGYINEVRGGTDRTKVIVLRADDYGGTVTVDVEVL
jgi:hypothetical protein